jgi:hypothetical protein
MALCGQSEFCDHGWLERVRSVETTSGSPLIRHFSCSEIFSQDYFSSVLRTRVTLQIEYQLALEIQNWGMNADAHYFPERFAFLAMS